VLIIHCFIPPAFWHCWLLGDRKGISLRGDANTVRWL